MKKFTTVFKSAAIVSAFAAAIVVFGSPAVSKAYTLSPDILVGEDLTIGSNNQNVVVLQGLLSEMGFLNIPTGVSYGYYGAMTKSALASYQTTLGVTPAVGYFGSITKSAIYSNFASRGFTSLLGW